MVEHGLDLESDIRAFVFPGISGRHFVDIVRHTWNVVVDPESDAVAQSAVVARLAAVLASNPTILDQPGVIHNLGQRKIAWCEQIIQGTAVMPRRPGRPPKPTAMERLDKQDEEGRG